VKAAPVHAALGAYLAWLAAQRGHELWLSMRHGRRLVARGAVEHGRGLHRLIVALHVAFPIALVAEVLALGVRPPPAWPAWLAVLGFAAGLRAWSMAALGGRWTARVWAVPETVPVRRGPYRFVRHPSYLAAALELFAAPLMFGAWRTAVACTALNGLLLARRIRLEQRVLSSTRPTADAPPRP
jgi:methyltransferase